MQRLGTGCISGARRHPWFRAGGGGGGGGGTFCGCWAAGAVDANVVGVDTGAEVENDWTWEDLETNPELVSGALRNPHHCVAYTLCSIYSILRYWHRAWRLSFLECACCMVQYSACCLHVHVDNHMPFNTRLTHTRHPPLIQGKLIPVVKGDFDLRYFQVQYCDRTHGTIMNVGQLSASVLSARCRQLLSVLGHLWLAHTSLRHGRGILLLHGSAVQYIIHKPTTMSRCQTAV